MRIINLSVTGARLCLPYPLVVPIDQPMSLQKRHGALMPCQLAYMSSTELAVAFFPSAQEDVRQALVRDVYTNSVVLGNRQATFALWPVLKRLGRLLMARS